MGTPAKRRRPLVPPPLRSLRVARSVTSAFHRLTRQLDAARKRGEATQEVQQQLDALGGREAYQEASQLTTSRFRTSRWVFSRLTKHGFRPRPGQPPLDVLEIGAVNLDLSSVPRWLHTRAIDLRSTHPRIEQRDFLTLVPASAYDVVVCCMVLNCVEDAGRRGTMLLACRAHLRPAGLLFLMLPLRCLTASPYMTATHLERLLACAGFEVVESTRSPKVAFLLARAMPHLADHSAFAPPPKRIVSGGSRLTNDFAITFAD